MRKHSCVVVLIAVLVVMLCTLSVAQSYTWPKTPMRGAHLCLPHAGYANTYTESDVKYLAENLKANVARIQIYHNRYPDDLSELKMIIGWCRKYDMHVVVNTLNDGWYSENMGGFWTDAGNRNAVKDWWRRFAAEYADYGDGISYDPVNEPHNNEATFEETMVQWNGILKEVVAAIREVDKVHAIHIEPLKWGTPEGIVGMEAPDDDNLVLGFHWYAPTSFTLDGQGTYTDQTGPLSQRMDLLIKPFCTKYNVPAWCSEFGVNNSANGAAQWLEDAIKVFESKNYGWCYYSYREEHWPVTDFEQNPAMLGVMTKYLDLNVNPGAGINARAGIANGSGFRQNTVSRHFSLPGTVPGPAPHSMWTIGGQRIAPSGHKALGTIGAVYFAMPQRENR